MNSTIAQYTGGSKGAERACGLSWGLVREHYKQEGEECRMCFGELQEAFADLEWENRFTRQVWNLEVDCAEVG